MKPQRGKINADQVSHVPVGILQEHRSYNLLRSEQHKENSALRQRFMANVEGSSKNACWYWAGAKNKSGYGVFGIQSKAWLAHRVSYFIFRGEPPQDKHVDHTCVNRWCVNPFHLQVVTHAENASLAKRRRDAVITHCPNGHELTEDNLVKHMFKSGTRKCRICFNEYDRQRQGKYRSGDNYTPRPMDTCLKGHPINEENTWMDSLPHDTVACKVCYAEYTKTPLSEVQKIGGFNV